MAETSGGDRKLPAEAFASHARRPNPSVDEHVAFPDDLPAQTSAPHALPQTVWAPRSRLPHQQQLPPELAQIPPEVTAILGSFAARPRPRSAGRLSPAGLGLAAVVALALIMGSNTSVDVGPPDSVVHERGWDREGVFFDGTEGGFALVPILDAVDSTIQPVDQPRYEIPLGPSTVRIEVVSDDPAADITVTSDSGDAQLGEVALPLGAEAVLPERPAQLAVTARNRYGQNSIQCRIYADGSLVSIATGVGLVECVAEPAR